MPGRASTIPDSRPEKIFSTHHYLLGPNSTIDLSTKGSVEPVAHELWKASTARTQRQSVLASGHDAAQQDKSALSDSTSLFGALR